MPSTNNAHCPFDDFAGSMTHSISQCLELLTLLASSLMPLPIPQLLLGSIAGNAA
jgi:hypothetical protein